MSNLTPDQLMFSPVVTGPSGPVQYALYVERLFKRMPDFNQTILHAAVGVSGEGGELLDGVKKAWAYGKELDRDNIKEECGDALFYIQAMANEMGWSMAELMQTNTDKLAKRYGESYSDAKAIARADKEPK